MDTKEAMIASSSSGATQVGSKRERTMGRRKIPIERISKEPARQVCFSKRRKGLFNKAHKLSVLCGAHVAVIVFSPGGKPYSFFMHPSDSSPSILDQYISFPKTVQCRVLQPDSFADLNALLASAKKRNEDLKKAVHGLVEGSILGADVASLSLDELEVVQILTQVKADVAFCYSGGEGSSSNMEMYPSIAVASPGSVDLI